MREDCQIERYPPGKTERAVKTGRKHTPHPSLFFFLDPSVRWEYRKSGWQGGQKDFSFLLFFPSAGSSSENPLHGTFPPPPPND